ncbi:MAG TPA: hypothetical protein VNQ57_10725 [Ureibacillus sp.]|nr:hypothetical protein [Ureibacillus sp.]
MALEVLIDNRDGVIWEVPLSSLTWKTVKTGGAGVLDCTLINLDPLKDKVVSGAVVRATYGEQKIFYGYSKKRAFSMSEEFKITAYDQLKYLKYSDTFVLSSMTASAAFQKICSDFGVTIGIVDDTKYKLPAMVEEDKEALDVLAKCLDSTLVATNNNFVMYDDFGKATLRNISSLVIDPTEFYIGEESLLYDFDYEASIEDSYNRIKLVIDDKEASKRKVFIAQDSANIAKWGRMQYYEKVDENMTAAQVEGLLDALLTTHNKEKETLTLKCLGDWRVRAGRMVFVYLEKLNLKKLFLVDECTHDWKSGVHTMSLKVKVV